MIRLASFDDLSRLFDRILVVEPSQQHGLFLLSIAIVLLSTGVVWADEEERDLPELSLQHVMSRTRNSVSARHSRLQVDTSRAAFDRLRGEEHWRLAVELDGNGGLAVEMQDDGGQTPLELPVQLNGTVELRKTLPTGGTLALGVTGSHTNSTIDNSFGQPAGQGATAMEEAAVVQETNASLRITQPLLRGVGWDLIGDRKIAAFQLRATRQAHRNNLNDLFLAVASAYWEVSFARQELVVRRGSLAVTQEQLRIVQTRKRAGRVSAAEVELVKQDIAAQKAQLLLARAQFTARCADLRRLAGMPSATARVEFQPSTPLKVTNMKNDRKSLAVVALRNNPQLAQRRAEFNTASNEADRAENQRWPRLDLEISASSRLSPDTDNQQWQARLVFEQELGGQRLRGLRDEARTRRRAARIEMEIIRQDILAAVARASAAYHAGRLRVAAAQRAVKQAQSVVKSEQARYRVGRSTAFDVLQRIQLLREAELVCMRAMADHLIAQAEIDALTGTLVAQHIPGGNQ